MSVQVIRKNPKWIEKLKLRLKKSDKLEAAVGFPKGKENLAVPHYDSGASILEVAIWNNFGTETTPRRPFMDDAAPRIQDAHKRLMKKGAQRLNNGELDAKTLLKASAMKAEAIVRDQIQTGQYVPNAPDTIRAKKSSKPLIWTGDMQKYVTSVVRKSE